MPRRPLPKDYIMRRPKNERDVSFFRWPVAMIITGGALAFLAKCAPLFRAAL